MGQALPGPAASALFSRHCRREQLSVASVLVPEKWQLRKKSGICLQVLPCVLSGRTVWIFLPVIAPVLAMELAPSPSDSHTWPWPLDELLVKFV